MREVLLGRQPIFDARLAVHAYELFFRFGERKHVASYSPDAATAEVVTEALTTFGLDRLAGRSPAHVNVPRAFLLEARPLPVAPERLVLEVRVSIGGDAPLLRALDVWRSRGFKIAIDDVRYDQRELWPLFERADELKVDVLGRAPDELAREVERLRRHQRPLVAEKVESRADVDRALGLGFQYLQGYFLERPGVVRTHGVEPARATLLRLIVDLQDPACDLERVHALVVQDAGLAFRILRCVNSAAYAIPRRIDSISEALMYLGLGTVRNLACLLLVTASTQPPRELLRLSLFRARLCELLGQALALEDRSRCFTVGMLSLFDALLDEPMPSILEHLPVSADVREALLEHRGAPGRILAAVKALERGEWADAMALELPTPEVTQSWIAASQWVEEVDTQIAAAGA